MHADFSPDAIWGFQGRDYSDKDFSAVPVGTMAAQTFDLATRWPGQGGLPRGFDPAVFLETGKEPGLGIGDLHDRGIDGRGIAVAVFDKPIRRDHEEFEVAPVPDGPSMPASRLIYHEVFDDEVGGRDFHFHGIAVASLLAGQTTGVAPAVTVHYFAVPDAGRNFHFYSLAAGQVIELNRVLPVDERIRLVVISDGIAADDPARDEWESALALLEGAATTVLYSGSPLLKEMVWGGCPPSRDRADPACYERALHLCESKLAPQTLLVPGDYRTMAANESPDAYVYRGRGGWSWAIPY
ncbi:MAG: hypothetical protein FJ109_21990, partial [Deltaproteobacteria bacterium]|nr:hypothetical protein [Deltaproteobacteria bacterium]